MDDYGMGGVGQQDCDWFAAGVIDEQNIHPRDDVLAGAVCCIIVLSLQLGAAI